jgi:hypothetical protein
LVLNIFNISTLIKNWSDKGGSCLWSKLQMSSKTKHHSQTLTQTQHSHRWMMIDGFEKQTKITNRMFICRSHSICICLWNQKTIVLIIVRKSQEHHQSTCNTLFWKVTEGFLKYKMGQKVYSLQKQKHFSLRLGLGVWLLLLTFIFMLQKVLLRFWF